MVPPQRYTVDGIGHHCQPQWGVALSCCALPLMGEGRAGTLRQLWQLVLASGRARRVWVWVVEAPRGPIVFACGAGATSAEFLCRGRHVWAVVAIHACACLPPYNASPSLPACSPQSSCGQLPSGLGTLHLACWCLRVPLCVCIERPQHTRRPGDRA